MKKNQAGNKNIQSARILEKLRKDLSSVITGWERPEGLFAIDPSRAAFVVIDMQRFTCDPAGGTSIPGVSNIIGRINMLADRCREVNIPVIWIRQSFMTEAGGIDTGLYPAFHTREQTKTISDRGKATEVFPGMHFDPLADHVVFKNRYSAFLSDPPEFKEKLDSLKRTQLIIAGVAANVCVESTARDAMQLGYEVVLVADGTTTISEALFENTLRNIMMFFGDVRTAQEIMDALVSL
ncbi:MAG TPA: cysteine hydrolase [Syntrophorhabdaceae bacterium]|nr:cysteine hydrolase [Syntrophorhabdaceae bacterium]